MNSVFEKLLKHTSFIIPKSPMCGFANQFLVADFTEKKSPHKHTDNVGALPPSSSLSSCSLCVSGYVHECLYPKRHTILYENNVRLLAPQKYPQQL